MNTSEAPNPISTRLLQWYTPDAHGMPWRGCGDPYGIWLSEVMLQQTQISTVIPYWNKFMDHYPDIAQLANADEESVLGDWAGLGYYSRGRNLHRAAKKMVEEHRSQFPRDPEKVRALPGVGEYTTAAICSIAFGSELAVVDGNVERVICRHQKLSGDPKRGETKLRIREVSTKWLHPDRPGDHNQAMMDLGRTVCTPRNPKCDECPIAEDCQARIAGEPHRWPQPKKRRTIEKQQWISALFSWNEKILLLPGNTELLKNHPGPVLARSEGDLDTETALIEEFARRNLGTPVIIGFGDRFRHTITHRQLDVQPVLCSWQGPVPDEARLIDAEASSKLPVLHRKALQNLLPLLGAECEKDEK